MNINLTPRTAAMVDDYAKLCGMKPEEFLDAFVEEFLVNRFADPQTGDADPFLLCSSY
jgi:hypothetical protein